MGFSLIASTFAYNNDSAQITTSAIDTRGADLIVLGGFGQSVPTVSDSQSISFTGLTSQQNGVATAKLFYKASPATNAAHTFKMTNYSQFGGIFAWAFSGVDTTSPLFGQSGSAGAGVSTIQPGAITPDFADALFITLISHADSASPATPSVDSGFTYNATQFTAGQHYGGGGGRLVVSGGSGAAVSPVWTNGGSFNSAAVMACFRPAVPTTLTLGAAAQGASTAFGLSVQDQISLTLAAAAQGASVSLGIAAFQPLRFGRFRGITLPRDASPWGVDPRQTRTLN